MFGFMLGSELPHVRFSPQCSRRLPGAMTEIDAWVKGKLDGVLSEAKVEVT
jgi:hypothetical protein